jgi:hypothetical protein
VGKIPTPTLAGELDRALGRYRIVRDPSYRRPPRYAPNGGLLRKGRLLSAKRPRVNIYVDRSGSFTPQKTAEAEYILSTILGKYGASIEKDTLEFSDSVGKEIERGRGTNYKAVYESVSKDRPAVAVVITDADGCDFLEKIPGSFVIIVPVGCVTTTVAKKWDGSVEVPAV